MHTASKISTKRPAKLKTFLYAFQWFLCEIETDNFTVLNKLDFHSLGLFFYPLFHESSAKSYLQKVQM